MVKIGSQDGVSERARRLASLGRRLKAASRWRRSPLPALWFLTDELRGDPLAVARTLPPGTGVVLRHYGAPDRAAIAAALSGIARERGLTLLVGADAALARAVKAHGVHLPVQACALRAQRAPVGENGLITASVHTQMELHQAAAWAPDAVFLAPVFATLSHKSARELGPVRFSAFVRTSPFPVIGLGGLTEAHARRLAGSGALGIGAIGAFIPSMED
jgi:thiamine-phosphate pyrophosphorylase